MKKILTTLLFFGLVGFNSAFGCDLKVGDKWIDDVPCCVVAYERHSIYKPCNKYSSDDFWKMNNAYLRVSRFNIEANKHKVEKAKNVFLKERDAYDKQLKELTGCSYDKIRKILRNKLEKVGLNIEECCEILAPGML